MIYVSLLETLEFLLSWIPEDTVWYRIAQLVIVIIIIGSLAAMAILYIKQRDKTRLANTLLIIRKIMEEAAQAAEALKAKDQVTELSADAKREIVLSKVQDACVKYGMDYVEDFWTNELNAYIAKTKEINAKK